MLGICKQKADEIGITANLYNQYMETLELPRQYRTILVPSSSLQLIIEPSLVDQALKRLIDHLLPGGVVAASIMALWKEGQPLESEWEKTAMRERDGVKFRRVSKSRYDPEAEYEHTEDLYQMIVDDKVVSEETLRRSPATRSYNQAQAKALFERTGFRNVHLYSKFTLDPVKPDDTMFVVVGQK
jgi:hypothetical protein